MIYLHKALGHFADKAYILFTCLAITFTVPSFGQTNISGIINSYWQVIAVDFCNNRVALPAIAVGIANGDKVLLIQMTGAAIDQADAASYGSITGYQDAGNYEWLTVADVTNNIITFKETILRSYDALNGKVQLVSVPQYVDADLIATVTAPAWDGNTGGIIAFQASGTVSMNANMDVTGKGFRGGAVQHHPGCYGGGSGSANYRCDMADLCGGNKGEGIADNGGFDLGRGAPANGGGGGNDNNTGGGGGSNFGLAGTGGQRLNTGIADCKGANPGIGGYALAYSNTDNKVFAGGGGGSGDDNTNEATEGANGGGIVLIKASTINGNGFSIYANGADQSATAMRDGGGGGGGGGVILLDVQNFSSALNTEVQGGNGGNVDNGGIADSCFGPGGGGGAGLLWLSGAGGLPANVTLNAAGGQAGLTLNANAPAACNGLSNGATAGTAGGTLAGLVITESTILFVPLALVMPDDTIVCIGTAANLTVHATGTGTLTYQWNTGETDSTINPSPTQSTVYIVTVTDSRGCSLTGEVTVDVKSNNVIATAFPDSIIVGQSTQLSADTLGNFSYEWFPSSGLDNDTVPNPIATPADTIEYCVIALGDNGCLDTACVTVNVTIPEPSIQIPTAFTPNGDGINDTWKLIVHPCYEILEAYIYNRWGRTVYSYQVAGSAEWSGTIQGQPQPMGAYGYFIKAKCAERDKEEVYKGTITLIR
ncbi:MAG: gliding motility-associated C-terminal domain-containing protein [Chitinophagales bacterium]|nr:gliding motility-associated C-terminal domain-containing protein [Chitinophagales bacterium]